MTRRRVAVAVLVGRDVLASLDVLGGLATGQGDFVVDVYAKDGRAIEPPALLLTVDAGSAPAPHLPTIVVAPRNHDVAAAVSANLDAIRRAVCSLVAHWHDDGARTVPMPPFSKFPGWSRLVGGVLAANLIGSFAPTVSVRRVHGSDPDFEKLVEVLIPEFGIEQFFAGRALRALEDHGVSLTSCDATDEAQRARQLGRFLADREGEDVGGWVLTVREHRTHRNIYAFVRADAAAADGDAHG